MRLRLAQLSRDAALRVRGVARLDPGPAGLFVTAGGGETVEGVVCVASADGYDVSVRAVCELVVLHHAARQVQDAIRLAARVAGVALGRVDVTVTDIVDPGAL